MFPKLLQIRFYYFFIFNFHFVCDEYMCTGATMQMWGSENNLRKYVLSFLSVGHGDKRLYPLSHPTTQIRLSTI